LKSISRADVDVQPYAFTTKSLFVGHFDYKMLRFQAIDTPGILDHALEDMNTIEMQSVTAIAHLRSAILYFMDLSEHCGYSVDAQIQLYHNIKPLFANKLTFIVINKIDLLRPDQLDQITKEKIDSILKVGEIELLEISCATTEGLMAARNAACDRLIAIRNAEKLKAGTNSAGEATGRLGELMRRIHVAKPLGGVTRELFIPDAAKAKVKYNKDDPNRPRLEKDIEEEEGGPGVYNINMKKNYLLELEEWKGDKIPEVFNGMNVYDFFDNDITAKLQALEDEEEKLEGEGFYDESDHLTDDEEAEIRYKAELIREKRQLIRNDARMRKSAIKNGALIPRSAKAKKLSEMERGLKSLGYDTAKITDRARSQSRGRALSARGRSERGDTEAMDVDKPEMTLQQRLRSKSRPADRSVSRFNRRELGLAKTGGDVDITARSKAERLNKLGQKKMNRMARQGEADRHTTAAMPKHLVSSPTVPLFAHAEVILTSTSSLVSVVTARHRVVSGSTFRIDEHERIEHWWCLAFCRKENFTRSCRRLHCKWRAFSLSMVNTSSYSVRSYYTSLCFPIRTQSDRPFLTLGTFISPSRHHKTSLLKAVRKASMV
jgi:nucleolar GTP-binding protein